MRPPIYRDLHLQQLVLTINVDNKNLIKIQNLVKVLPCCSTIFYSSTKNEQNLYEIGKKFTPLIQDLNCAVLIAESIDIAQQINADGCYFEKPDLTLMKLYKQQFNDYIIGIGNIKSKHQAMEYGEIFPDFLLFGSLNQEKAATFPAQNMSLASWWASLMEIPCIIQASNHLEDFELAVQTEAEFIALDTEIFSTTNDEQATNTLIDKITNKLGME